MLENKVNMHLLKKCSECGACFDICPVCKNMEGYDPREIIKDILAGEHEKWLESHAIWQCLECHHCLEMCYQHYGFESAITAMRNLAIMKGKYPEQVRRGWEMFAKTGRLGEPALPARKRLGLPDPAEGAKEEFLKLFEAYKEMKKKKGSK